MHNRLSKEMNFLTTPFVIAEIGLNHEGNLNTAKELIEVAKKTRCDAVKFQLRSPNTFRKIKGHRDIGSEIVDDYIERTFMDFEAYGDLYRFSLEIDMPCLFSTWDMESTEYAKQLNPPAYKVASADLRNIILLDKLIETGKHLILSTGMSSEKEIDQTIEYLMLNNVDFSLLHCHSAYPAPLHHLNLGYIKKLKSKGNFNVGYSSHDVGVEASMLALALGATIFEKHITLDKSGYGNDNSVSLEPDELAHYVDSLKNAAKMISGENSKREIGPGEKFNKISLAKSLVSRIKVKKGSKVDINQLEFSPSGEGLPPSELINFKDKALSKDLEPNTLITSSYFFEEELLGELAYLKKLHGGIPVRYRDFNELTKKFNLNFFEIHLSCGDLKFKGFENMYIPASIKIGFHAPDIYEDNLIFDPTSSDSSISAKSLTAFVRALDHITSFMSATGYSEKVNIVTSFSCFSEACHNESRKREYNSIANLIHQFHEKYPKIKVLPQTLPALAWYLGGQRYVNTFAHPQEVLQFCLDTNLEICLDISHLIMACNFYNLNPKDWIDKLIPYSSHFHLAGASGIDNEGLNISESEIAVSLTNSIINDSMIHTKTFIAETWQGHLNNGEGFVKDIRFLNELLSTND